MTAAQGPGGPAEGDVQGPGGSGGRDAQGPGGPAGRDVQGPVGPAGRGLGRSGGAGEQPGRAGEGGGGPVASVGPDAGSSGRAERDAPPPEGRDPGRPSPGAGGGSGSPAVAAGPDPRPATATPEEVRASTPAADDAGGHPTPAPAADAAAPGVPAAAEGTPGGPAAGAASVAEPDGAAGVPPAAPGAPRARGAGGRVADAGSPAPDGSGRTSEGTPGAELPDPDLSGPVAEQLLRPAAELAIEVARAGARMQPPLEVPSRLRPLLTHAKVTKQALAAVRRVVAEDAAFRARVANALQVPAVEATVGPAGTLWLRRPEGWEAALDDLVADASAAAAAKAEHAEERSAQRRLRHAEQARQRAEQAAEEAWRAAEAARSELQEERRLRRAADEAAGRATRQAASLSEQLAAAQRTASAATDRAAELAEAVTATSSTLSAAEDELRRVRDEVAELRGALARQPRASAPAAPPPEPAALDRQALGDAVAAASAAASALGTALARAAAALDASAPGRAEVPPVGEGADPSGHRIPGHRRPTQPRWARRQRRGRGSPRRPAPLPPMVHDDSPEAAQHLVGLPGVSLLVDGYNATLSTWPDLPLPEQRLRLIDALAELAARTGARPEVVFDGADLRVDLRSSRAVRSGVRVSFTEPEIEADDVLIARAAALPLPVIVASDDRRVRLGAKAAGANVLGVEQLLAALRRQTPR